MSAALERADAMRAAKLADTGETCGWIIDGDGGLTCDRPAKRGTQITGPLCDEHGEEDQRESEGR
jgi:hypothetical protein